MPGGTSPVADLTCLRALAVLDDSSPGGFIALDFPAGNGLLDVGIEQAKSNSYGSRRGNREVLMRGTFADIRRRNSLVRAAEEGFTNRSPSGDPLKIPGASERYRSEGTSTCIVGCKEFGTGLSRDRAAKDTNLLGMKFVLTECYESVHRLNLIGMAIHRLQLKQRETRGSLGLMGEETFAVHAR